MIKATLTDTILRQIIHIENKKDHFGDVSIPKDVMNRLRKNSYKKSSYASLKIEGNPLDEHQTDQAIESQKRHFLKPEQEVRNYYQALKILEKSLEKKEKFSKKLILKVQKQVVEGESKEKVGFRGPMPPGFLFAVYDSKTGNADYIPPEYSEIEVLLDELVDYVNHSDNHPLIKAAIVHYQLVTIHPFEDGNGRTARLLSGYILDYYGYNFDNLGSLEEYFMYNQDEYYQSLQMDLPALYYLGRDNPPHPEIWVEYFLRMLELYAERVSEIKLANSDELFAIEMSQLNSREKAFIQKCIELKKYEITPIEMARIMKVTNRTVINWCAKCCASGLMVPRLDQARIRTYYLSELVISYMKQKEMDN